jgi:hypothetical protein
VSVKIRSENIGKIRLSFALLNVSDRRHPDLNGRTDSTSSQCLEKQKAAHAAHARLDDAATVT